MTHSSLLVSALAHIGLLILAAVGLPTLHDPPDPVEVPIPVTVTMVSERTEAKGPIPAVEPSPPETPLEPPEPEPVAVEPPPEKPVEPPEPEPVAVEPPPVEPPPEKPVEVAALAPEPPKPEPPPEPAPVVAPLAPSLPEPEPAPPERKPPPLPLRPPQQQARAKPPPPKPEPAPEPVPLPQAAPEDPPDELAALRQAARPDELDTLRSAVSQDAPVPREEAEKAEFTVSEVHRLFRQLSRCWQTIPGLAPSERHIVVLEVGLGQDRRVKSVKAIDGKSSRSYRAAQERAVRALRHPFCEQLDVPPGKMSLWKSLTLRFDPHRMQ